MYSLDPLRCVLACVCACVPACPLLQVHTAATLSPEDLASMWGVWREWIPSGHIPLIELGALTPSAALAEDAAGSSGSAAGVVLLSASAAC